MQGMHTRAAIRNAITLASTALILSGCLMGEEKAKSNEEIAADISISGSVGDGPVVSAAMTALRNDGQLLAEFASDASANYSVMVNTMNRYYPLTITASGGVDLVTGQAPDFDLSGAVFVADSAAVANINPFSTLAIEIARAMPDGISAANLETAERYVVAELNSGLTSMAGPGPMRTRIDADNVAEVVKASEALGETVRRTRDLQRTFGRISTGDVVVRQIAADLADGIVDGRGSAGTDARVSAIQSLVSVQVFLESMHNELHVNGVDASNAMESAINQVSATPPTQTAGEQRGTAEMLARIRLGLDALIAVNSNPALVELREAAAGLQAGMDEVLVRTIVPGNYRQTLAAAILNIAGGSDTNIDTINDVLRDGAGNEPPANRAPSIAGTPGRSIAVGVNYVFTPVASDPDGDVLTFSVTGLPAWASFDATTGRLSGTPGSDDVGSFDGIGISVSDGNASASLPDFSIAVTMTNSAPTIAGTPPAQVAAGSAYSFMPTANDPDGDALTFSVSGLPTWADFDTADGHLSGTPAVSDAGSYDDIVITVSDGTESAALGPFSITVVAGNNAPTISGTPPSEAGTGINYSFTPTANDADGDTLTFSVASLPVWAVFDSGSGEISGVPAREDVGTYNNIVISVSDGLTIASLAPFSITVNFVNGVPTISGSPAGNVYANYSYQFTPVADDVDGDPLSFTVSGLPSWASFDAATGSISGTPVDADIGDYANIVVSVSDGLDSASLPPFTITVEQVVLGSATLNWTPPTQNSDGSTLEDLAGYKIYWRSGPGAYANSVTIDNPGLSSYVVEDLFPGNYEFVSTAYNSVGVESDYSNVVSRVVP